VVGEQLRSLEHHRQDSSCIGSGSFDLVHHRLEDRGLVALADLVRLQVAQAALWVRADDCVDGNARRFRIGCRRT
jgi:hypothetical protein